MFAIYGICAASGVATYYLAFRLDQGWRLGLAIGVAIALGLLATAFISRIRDAPLPGSSVVHSAVAPDTPKISKSEPE